MSAVLHCCFCVHCCFFSQSSHLPRRVSSSGGSRSRSHSLRLFDYELAHQSPSHSSRLGMGQSQSQLQSQSQSQYGGRGREAEAEYGGRQGRMTAGGEYTDEKLDIKIAKAFAVTPRQSLRKRHYASRRQAGSS